MLNIVAAPVLLGREDLDWAIVEDVKKVHNDYHVHRYQVRDTGVKKGSVAGVYEVVRDFETRNTTCVNCDSGRCRHANAVRTIWESRPTGRE